MFKRFLPPCAGGGGHGPQGFQDGRRLLLQVLADVQDHREGDQDDHQAQRKSEGVVNDVSIYKKANHIKFIQT